MGMKIEISEIWKDRFCNECHKQGGVKSIFIGAFELALCEDCRKKLAEILIKEVQDGEM